MNGIAVSTSEFDTILKTNPVVFVDFQAEWCLPCRTMTPIVGELSKQYQGKVKAVSVGVDSSRELARRYQITAIPCFMIFSGNRVDSIVGTARRERLDTAIKNALGG